jgi:2-C-methyl-D-erythritol 4-phosphate cytidylyltransferase
MPWRVSEDADFIAVHDAVRLRRWIDQVLRRPAPVRRAICPATSNLSMNKDGIITETVSREGLHMAQTPQVFRRTGWPGL